MNSKTPQNVAKSVIKKSMLLGGVFALIVSSFYMQTPSNALAQAWKSDVGFDQISSGENHSCALESGTIYCWGLNQNGRMGIVSNYNTVELPTPVVASGAFTNKNVTAVEVGGGQTCAIADAQAYCWGANDSGQLGIGTMVDTIVPVEVDFAGKVVTQISTGREHTCAIADAQAYCWGANSRGQLGNNSTENSQVPVAVDQTGVLAGKVIENISVGLYGTCAIADAQAYCWGANDSGQLGNGEPGADAMDSLVPVAVDQTGALAGKSITSITSTDSHVCALAQGQAYCWGANGAGQLGDGTTEASAVPVAIDKANIGAEQIDFISAGSGSSCAITQSDKAYCWGNNFNGQLGLSEGFGNNDGAAVPTQVDTTGALAGKSFKQISTDGGRVTCSLSTDGYIYCWGQDLFSSRGVDYEQLDEDGINSSDYRATAVQFEYPEIESGWGDRLDFTTTEPASVSIYGEGFFKGSIVKINDVVIDDVEYGNYNSSLNVSFDVGDVATTPGFVDVEVITPRGDSVKSVGAIEFYVPSPKQITSVEIEAENNGKRYLTVTGTGLVGDSNPTEFILGIYQSLVTLDDTELPFCSEGTGSTAAGFADTVASPDLVSDEPPCYLLISSTFSPLITPTSAVVLLPTDFDENGRHTVSVNGSPEFTFGDGEEPTPVEAPTVGINGRTPGSATQSITKRPAFSGTAMAGSRISVSIQGSSLTCSATADSDGVWACGLSQDLRAGNYSVLVTVVDPDDTTTELGPYSVAVASVPQNTSGSTPSKNTAARAAAVERVKTYFAQQNDSGAIPVAETENDSDELPVADNEDQYVEAPAVSQSPDSENELNKDQETTGNWLTWALPIAGIVAIGGGVALLIRRRGAA